MASALTTKGGIYIIVSLSSSVCASHICAFAHVMATNIHFFVWIAKNAKVFSTYHLIFCVDKGMKDAIFYGLFDENYVSLWSE